MKHPALHGMAVRIVPVCVAWLLRSWFATCRSREHGETYRRRVLAEGKPVIAVFWHYSLAYLLYYMRDYRAAALVSASRDGDYLAGLAKRFHFSTVRGSRNRRGLRALMELLGHVQAGEHVALVADGSQGPPLQAQGGPIMIASKSGSPILPIVWSASSYFTFPSWDRTALPRPFSRIDVHFGEPLLVPEGLDAAGIETYRLELERSLLSLYQQAWSRYGKEGH